MNTSAYFIFYFSLFILLSCERPIERKVLTIKNPTSHVFNVPKNDLKDKILVFFNKHYHMHSKFYESSVLNFYVDKAKTHKIQVGFIAETSDDATFGKSYFYGYKTSEDIYLYTGEAWLSPIYYSRGKPLEFRSNYVIKLTSVDSTRTKISVIADGPEVINGTKWGGMHGRMAKTFPVKGTSVEEYTLILFIAEQLGIGNLKELNLITREDL